MILTTRRIGLLLSFTLLFLFQTVAQTPTPTPDDTDKPETVFTEEIKLNVSAFDQYGEFVTGVGSDDVVIVEDGRLHQATSIRRIPASVLIVLDTGGEMRSVKGIAQTRNVALNLINLLSAEDSIAVMEYNNEPRILSEWSSDKNLAKGAIETELNFGRRSMFMDAMKLATEFLRKSENENRHLVLITDGTDSEDRGAERQAEMNRLLATNINVHVISYTRLEINEINPKTKRSVKAHPNTLPTEVVDGLPAGVKDVNQAPKFGAINLDKKMIRALNKRKSDLENGEKYLLELTENTSGMFILPDTKSEMIEKAELIAKIIDSNYVVTYTPKRPLSEAPNGEVRIIEVSSRRPGLRVAARRKLVVNNEMN